MKPSNSHLAWGTVNRLERSTFVRLQTVGEYGETEDKIYPLGDLVDHLLTGVAQTDDLSPGGDTAALDRLAAKLQTYRARSINSSQASLLDAFADDIAEEREKVRGGGQ